ncbi:MAG: hypothetical protein IJG65_03045 [Synergistaceae bacterium]|nr:hypothetical protein [Synergistaceae bacterium]
MKRKGETFTEFLAAMTIFGIMMGGMFEFIAGQTENLTNIKDRDDMMFYANWLSQQTLNGDNFNSVHGGKVSVWDRNILRNIDHDIEAGHDAGTYSYTDGEITIPTIDSPIRIFEHEVVSFDWDKNKMILTVKKNDNITMQFTLKP